MTGLAKATDGQIVIAIPTFRRPVTLKQLLDSLAPEVRGTRTRIIVGDNDCSDEIKRIVDRYSDRAKIEYHPVPERGLSQVRNALVSKANAVAPDWRWLLMLDDDGWVQPGWLSAMTGAGEQFDADLVGGPVIGVLPDGASVIARNSVFASRRRWPSGPVSALNTTQNLAISRRVLDRLGLPLFDNRLGASGGEDYDLFRRTVRAGGRLAWCDEAVVMEPAPPERLTLQSLLHRYFSTGLYMSRIDLNYESWPTGLGKSLLGLTRSAGEMLFGSLAGRSNLAARGTLMTAHYFGRLGGLSGFSGARYSAGEQS
ncbi:MAG: glycosyltransferase [Caulobacterales bacterium]